MIRQVRDGCNILRDLSRGEGLHGGRDVRMVVRLQGEGGDNAEVGAASLERPEEVAVRGVGGDGDDARGEHDGVF